LRWQRPRPIRRDRPPWGSGCLVHADRTEDVQKMSLARRRSRVCARAWAPGPGCRSRSDHSCGCRPTRCAWPARRRRPRRWRRCAPSPAGGGLQRVVAGQHLHGGAVHHDGAVLAVGLEAGLDRRHVAAAGVCGHRGAARRAGPPGFLDWGAALRPNYRTQRLNRTQIHPKECRQIACLGVVRGRVSASSASGIAVKNRLGNRRLRTQLLPLPCVAAYHVPSHADASPIGGAKLQAVSPRPSSSPHATRARGPRSAKPRGLRAGRLADLASAPVSRFLARRLVRRVICRDGVRRG
jgi:hypothetical protein